MEDAGQLPKDFPSEDWKHARRQVLYQKVVCAVTRCSVDLLSFEDVRKRFQLHERSNCGLREIPLNRIRGSVGRFDDFTSTFLPLKDHMRERWQQVDKAVVKGKVPPIEVYKVGEVYFVLDGNHRVSAAREHGFERIEAFVTEFQAPFEAGTGIAVEDFVIQAERERFLEKYGEAGAWVAKEIAFSCPGCYQDLADQLEAYRQGLAELRGEPVERKQALASWHHEVFGPAVRSIRKHDLLRLFPDRTEADLFLWAWKNGRLLEL